MRIGERICEAARKYCRQGFAPIPIPYRQKGPVQHGWQKLRITEQTLQLHFNGQAQNIGILLGQASDGLVDVDLDCPEAELLAAGALPDTGLKTGRISKPKSHFFYRASGVKTRKFTDPEDHSMLVEIRSDGCQTVFPPSVHPTGESYNFASEGEPAVIPAKELVRAVSEVAGLALLSRHWPAKGSRQDTALALAGALLRSGNGIESVERTIRLVCHTAHDEEVAKRVMIVRTTSARLSAGGNTFGFSKLKELIGGAVASRALEWLAREHGSRLPVEVLEPADQMEQRAMPPPFPEIAWRGIFDEYREAMSGTTEASDVAHFAALWTAAAANLGRRVSIFAGDEIFPNVYILFYGPTGDKKTTAKRRIFRHNLLAPTVQILRNL
jgi:hypothetical protein